MVVHAVIPTFQYKEISHKEKHTRQIAEKRFIARKAASLIEDGDTLFSDQEQQWNY